MGRDIHKKLIDAAPFAYAYQRVIVDDTGRIVDYVFLEINTAFETMFGVKRCDVENRRVTDVIPEAKSSDFDWVGYFGSIALDGGERDFQLYVPHLGKWLRVCAYSAEEGTFAAFVFDVTAENSNATEIERFFEVNLDLMCITDMQGRFIKTNRAWATYLGYEPEEINGLDYFSFIHPDDVPQTRKILERLSEQLPVPAFVNRYRAKDGAYRQIEWKPHRYGEFVYASGRDTTERITAEHELRESRRQLTSLFAGLPGMSYRCRDDHDWTMEFVGEGSIALTGYRPDELVGNAVVAFNDLIHPDDRDTVRTAWQIAIAKKTEYSGEYRIVSRADIVKWVWERGRGVYSADGSVAAIEGFITDVTERKLAELAIAYQNGFQKLIADISTEFVGATIDTIDDKIDLMLSKCGEFFDVDRSYLFRFSADGKTMSNTHEWCAPGITAQKQSLQNMSLDVFAWWAARMRTQIREKKPILIADVSAMPEEAAAERKMFAEQEIKSLFCVPIESKGEAIGFFGFDRVGKKGTWDEGLYALLTVIANTIADALEKNKLEHELTRSSITDPLTGLFNRRYLYSRLGSLIDQFKRQDGSLCVAMLDIDHFKDLNDSYGHAAGDVVLARFAEILGEGVRSFDIVARYGGEEFVVVLVGAVISLAASIADRVLESVRRCEFVFGGDVVRFTISGGVADIKEIPRDSLTSDSVIELADRRLYAAKVSGRDRIVPSEFEPRSARAT